MKLTYLIVLIVLTTQFKAHSQPNINELFLNAMLDFETLSQPLQSQKNPLLQKLINNQEGNNYYKLISNTKDPLLNDTLNFTHFKGCLLMPDSVFLKYNSIEILSFSPSRYIYEVQIQRYYSNLESAHLVYNLLLEKLIERLKIYPKSNFIASNSEGIVSGTLDIIVSTGMFFKLDTESKMTVSCDFEKINTKIYSVTLEYQIKDF